MQFTSINVNNKDFDHTANLSDRSTGGESEDIVNTDLFLQTCGLEEHLRVAYVRNP